MSARANVTGVEPAPPTLTRWCPTDWATRPGWNAGSRTPLLLHPRQAGRQCPTSGRTTCSQAASYSRPDSNRERTGSAPPAASSAGSARRDSFLGPARAGPRSSSEPASSSSWDTGAWSPQRESNPHHLRGRQMSLPLDHEDRSESVPPVGFEPTARGVKSPLHSHRALEVREPGRRRRSVSAARATGSARVRTRGRTRSRAAGRRWRTRRCRACPRPRDRRW